MPPYFFEVRLRPALVGIFFIAALLSQGRAISAPTTISRAPLQALSLYSPDIWRSVLAEVERIRACGLQVERKKAKILGLSAYCQAPSPGPWRLELWDQPSAQAVSLGWLELRPDEKLGLRFRFIPSAKSKKPIPFSPDISCPFIRSDCFAEHTILEKQGDWIRLPARPWPGSVWVNLRKSWNTTARAREIVIPGRSYQLLRSPRATRQTTGNNQFLHEGEEIFVKQIVGGNLIVRRALPGDEKCAPEDQDLAQGQPEYAVAMSELYDGRGRLRIQPAYADYCVAAKEALERNLKLGDPTAVEWQEKAEAISAPRKSP